MDGTSAVQSGDLNYPDQAWYVIATYKDNDEFFPHRGILDELRVYERALTEEEIQQNHNAEFFFSVAPVEKLGITWGRIKISQ